jgi:transposase
MFGSEFNPSIEYVIPPPLPRCHGTADAIFDKFEGEVSAGSDLLDLPGLHTTGFKKTHQDILIRAEVSLSHPERCPACGGFLFTRNGAPPHIVKDQPTLGRRARLYFKWQRYHCQTCGHSWQQTLPGINTRAGMTERLLNHIERESMKMQSFARVAAETGVSAQTVYNVFTALALRLEEKVRPARQFPRRIGVDECYVDGVARFVITDLDRRRTFELLPKRDKLTLTRYFIQLPHPERVEVVVMDMWKPYRDVMRKFLPDAKIVIDKFHVLQKANDAVMAVRRRIREGLPPSRRDRCMPNNSPRKGKGKRSRFLLLKRARNLKDHEKPILKEWKAQYPEIAAAYDLKEELFDLWELRDRAEAERRYEDWARRVRTHPLDLQLAFHELLREVENWREEIFNYFDYPYTNGQTEARNNVMKSMQRQGRGYDFETVRVRMLYREEVLPPREPHQFDAGKRVIRRPGKKRPRRKPDPDSPRSNVGKTRRARKAHDVFTELLRSPEGFVERFKHFGQLELFWDLPYQDEQGRPSAGIT